MKGEADDWTDSPSEPVVSSESSRLVDLEVVSLGNTGIPGGPMLFTTDDPTQTEQQCLRRCGITL